MSQAPRIAFFGTSEFSVFALDAMEKRGLTPALIITAPDAPQGRKLIITPCPAKVWAISRGIEVLSPEKLRSSDFMEKITEAHTAKPFDVFIVASYGKIIPQAVLDIATRKTLNIHPSLLPAFRGPSPIESAILADNHESETGKCVTGVTIIELDADMDHGPIIAAKKWLGVEWPTREILEKELATMGAEILADVLPDWISGKIIPTAQNHDIATFTEKFEKADGLLDLSSADSYHDATGRKNFLKIQAMSGRPTAYTFFETKKGKMRVIIKEAIWEKGSSENGGLGHLKINRVIPEGKNEMSFTEFQKNFLD